MTASHATLDATEEYANIAQEAGMTPSQLAFAFVRSRQFVESNGSVIVGATTLEQLKENLSPFDGNDVQIDEDSLKKIDEDSLKKIDEVHMKYRDPSCSL